MQRIERIPLSNPFNINEVTNQTTINLNRKISILQDMKNPRQKAFMKTKTM